MSASPVISTRPEFAGILREQETFATDDQVGVGNDINGWFDRLMIQAGWKLAPSAVLALCLLCGIGVGGAVYVLLENPIAALLGGLLGLLAPIVSAIIIRARRQSLMMTQMSPMIDELARAAKTGRSLENCLQLVANDTPAPLGEELRQCTGRVAMGLPVSAALEELPYRTGLVSTSVLATALTVHQQTGGDLVRVLERLAQTIRDRIQFQGRLKAATSASRAVAFLMVVLPVAILLFFIWRDPEGNYLQELWSSSWGRMATSIAIVLQIIGAALILRILATSERA